MATKHFKRQGICPSASFFNDDQQTPAAPRVSAELEPIWFKGFVKMYRPDKRFGFIRPDDGTADKFFHQEDFVPDGVGRRLVFTGMPVEFTPRLALAHQKRRGVSGKTFQAYYTVRSLWQSDEPTPDLVTYREESVLTGWFPPPPGERWYSGFATRPDGSSVSVFESNIITSGIDQLRVGSRIYHGVHPPKPGDFIWLAVSIEVFMEPEPTPEPTPESTLEPVIEIPKRHRIFDEAFRNVPLRKLGVRKIA